jgi:hypothetical protein
MFSVALVYHHTVIFAHQPSLCTTSQYFRIGQQMKMAPMTEESIYAITRRMDTAFQKRNFGLVKTRRYCIRMASLMKPREAK